jgi:catechol 2,3-dioxygenase-like lactoylglutathione lyase family enzyme
MRVNELDHLVLTVHDVEATARWYEDVLGLARETVAGRDGAAPRTGLRLGRQLIRLRPAAATQHDWRTGRQAVAGSADLCFLVEAGVEDVLAHLDALGVPVESGPVRKHGALGPIQSVYCRDPDGNLVEIGSARSARG